MGGKEKDCKGVRLIFSTWQSIYTLPEEYFNKFETVIGDECHSVKNKHEAEAMLSLLQKTKNAHYRMGATGTLKDGALNKLQVVSVFGKIHKVTTTRKLMDRGIISSLAIKAVHIKYPEDITSQVDVLEWDSQQEFVESDDNPRQHIVVEIAKKMKENTIVLFRKRTHGEFLYNELLKSSRTVEYIDGNTHVDDREKIRFQMENSQGLILVCSYGTTSTGINISNLHNIIFASSYKSKIKILQSIGRSLRKHKTKEKACVYDLIDGIHYFKEHFKSRKELYLKEKFDFTEKTINLVDFCKEKNIDFF